jgi:hypothetical protein
MEPSLMSLVASAALTLRSRIQIDNIDAGIKNTDMPKPWILRDVIGVGRSFGRAKLRRMALAERLPVKGLSAAGQ